jgi:hypothetical protein
MVLMEWNVLVEHVEQCLEEKAVQTDGKAAGKTQKKRSQSDKAGINRWTQQLVIRCLDKLESMECQMRWIRNKFDRLGIAEYSKEDIEHFEVLDAVDREIMQRLLEVGVSGALPKDVAAEVNKRGGYGLKYYEVSRRCVRLNKRLHFETGNVLFEKRGHKWALTKFAFDVYGATEAEVERVQARVVVDEEETKEWR